ncbi:MAG: hypothetical protein IJU76_15210, partial [Desulfovibrionaceae bacterium]|nr:hypothetical protein [Desulfovibrionaceae bacterium]
MSLGKYSESDICILLREDPLVKILSVEEKEQRINSGKHYSEMISLEKDVSKNHFFLYRQILDLQKEWLASASISVVKKIYETFKNPLFISLARCLLSGLRSSSGLIIEELQCNTIAISGIFVLFKRKAVLLQGLVKILL